MTTEYRAEFDAEVSFANGGGLTARRFRLDVDSDDIAPAELGTAFIRELGLRMVSEVKVSSVRVFAEAHKGRRSAAPAPAARRIIELSHRIHHGMVTYPGLPAPTISEWLSREASKAIYAAGTCFHIGRIDMIANTGTYLDTPFHRYEDGVDLAGFAVERFADLDGVVVRVTGHAERGIGAQVFAPYDLAGRAVLVETGWDRHFGTEAYGAGHPFLTADAAAHIVRSGAALIGIDSLNIDENRDGTRPAHSALLAAAIPIVEHMTGLGALPVTGFRFHAAPAPVVGMGTFPVRAYAVLERG